jgi:hypothetical protein
MGKRTVTFGILQKPTGDRSTLRAATHVFIMAFYKGGGSAQRDLALFNIAQTRLYIRGL